MISATDIRPGDIFGVLPHGLMEHFICKETGASTFHYGVFVMPGENGWITSESVNKGTDLRQFDYKLVKVYRIKEVKWDEPNPAYQYQFMTNRLLNIHAENGDLPYNWEVDVLTGIWFIVTHWLHRKFPMIKTKGVNCVGWAILVAAMLGFKLITDDCYPAPAEIEHSPLLEYVGEYQPVIECPQCKGLGTLQ